MSDEIVYEQTKGERIKSMLDRILLDKIQVELRRHHLHPGWMASPNHEGYHTWGVTCVDHYDNPDTDCEFSVWGHTTKDEAAAAWYRHVAESVLAAVSRNPTGESK